MNSVGFGSSRIVSPGLDALMNVPSELQVILRWFFHQLGCKDVIGKTKVVFILTAVPNPPISKSPCHKVDRLLQDKFLNVRSPSKNVVCLLVLAVVIDHFTEVIDSFANTYLSGMVRGPEFAVEPLAALLKICEQISLGLYIFHTF